MYVRARSLVFSVVVSLVAVVFLVPGFAFAASFAPTNVTVAVDRNTVTQGYGETITSTLSFCVPDAQSAGDSFTVTLPEVLSNWPAGFSLLDGTGQAVIEVSISSASPAVATFTLTTYGGESTTSARSPSLEPTPAVPPRVRIRSTTSLGRQRSPRRHPPSRWSPSPSSLHQLSRTRSGGSPTTPTSVVTRRRTVSCGTFARRGAIAGW